VPATLSTITFPGADGGADSEGDERSESIDIATIRPELLAACVAVNPEDERYADRIGDTVEVPLFSQEVEVIADEVAGAMDEYRFDAARAALFTAVSASLRMLVPFVTEEAWHALPGTAGSVHGSAWPEPGIADRESEPDVELVPVGRVAVLRADHSTILVER